MKLLAPQITLYQEELIMKIAIVAANGKAGKLIVREAVDRGMDVTALVREDNKSAAQHTVVKDIFAIPFYDIYKAVDSVKDEGLFHFHEHPNPDCPVGRNIHAATDCRLSQIQTSMENEMKQIKLSDVIEDVQKEIQAEQA